MATTIKQLRCILKTAELSSITKAADALSVSRVTVSEAISDMEEAAGFAIFERQRRGVAPTSRGLNLIASAQRIVSLVDDFDVRFRATCDDGARFSVSMLNLGFAVDALIKLSRMPKYGCYGIACDVAGAARVFSNVKSGISSMGIIYRDKWNERMIDNLLLKHDLVYHEIFSTNKQYAWMSTRHPLASRKLVSLADLEEYPEFNFEQYFHVGSATSQKPEAEYQEEDGILLKDDSVDPVDMIKGVEDVNGFALWYNFLPARLAGTGVTAAQLIDDLEPSSIGYITPKDSMPEAIGLEYVSLIREYNTLLP